MPSLKKLKRILFPVDFSDSSIAAARYVETFAGRFEAEVMLLHVVGMGEHALASELLPGRQAQLNAFLADEFKYFTTQRICVIGDPATEILDTAHRWLPDMVMMPTRGLGAFRRLLLGSVTAKALHDLSCPVWTSPHLETAPLLEEIHFRRILCALDLTERSGCVLEWAAWLASQCQADLGIVHASAELPSEYYGWDLEKEFVESVAADAKREIEKLQTAAGSSARVFVTPGYPATVVAEAARNFDADLLVMGRHAEAGIAGYLRHSAYAILRDSPCSVISI
jgi:nucleotide-binding universal stress UspA family protein